MIECMLVLEVRPALCFVESFNQVMIAGNLREAVTQNDQDRGRVLLSAVGTRA